MKRPIFCGDCVAFGSSWYVITAICTLYASYCVFAIISTYYIFYECLQKFTILMYAPIVISAVVLIFLCIVFTTTDPGFMPIREKRSCQLPEYKDQMTFDSLDYSQIIYQNSQNHILEMCEKVAQIKNKKKLNHCSKKATTSSEETLELVDQVEQQQMEVHSDLYDQKRCYTCKISKLIGIGHCTICDQCVALLDHHCPFYGTCVGIRNHSLFIKINIAALIHLTISIIYNTSGLVYCCYLYITDQATYNRLNFNIAITLIMQLWSILWALAGLIFTAYILHQQNVLLKYNFTLRGYLKKNRSLFTQIDQMLQIEKPQDRIQYMQAVVQSDPILSKHYQKILTLNPKQRRLKLGKLMPSLRNMHPYQAEATVWRWTLVLSGYDASSFLS